MRHPIDPKVDCVFKALLGAESNRALLIHFLNAVLGAALPEHIVQATILNPYNEKEFLDDKLSVVDVKARDQHERQYQIEIQLLCHPDLPARILYGWADLYSAQLREGQDYGTLRPTYGIWLLGETLLRGVSGYAHSFRLRDDEGRLLLDHGGIWLLELSKFHRDVVETEQQRWLKFFNEAEALDEAALPSWMQTEQMRQAMSTLKAFSEKEQAYHAYQARQNYLREQRSIQRHLHELEAEVEKGRETMEQQQKALEQERAAKEEARRAEEQARAAEQEALAEVERLRRLLKE
jgi:predicted transposase/invertase (TIGR01784 family)